MNTSAHNDRRTLAAFDALRNARIQEVKSAANTLKTALIQQARIEAGMRVLDLAALRASGTSA